MQPETWFTLAIIAVVLNAIMDEIDHKKGGQTLYDLWHLVKPICFGFIFLSGHYFEFDLAWWEYPVVIAIGIGFWELSYKIATKLKIHELDNRFRIPMPFRILGFGRNRKE